MIVIGLNTQYSKIILNDGSEHIVPNHGNYSLEWWIEYFKNKEK